jgi:hypothetical protein
MRAISRRRNAMFQEEFVCLAVSHDESRDPAIACAPGNPWPGELRQIGSVTIPAFAAGLSALWTTRCGKRCHLFTHPKHFSPFPGPEQRCRR